MKILFVNEKLGWFGGVEQNVGDTADGLRAAGHSCFLAWGEKTIRNPDGFAQLFEGTAPCRELGAAGGESLGAIASRFAVDMIYFHKIGHIPTRAELGVNLPLARMVHDHDLCCPRHHKYFVHNAHVCHHPAGWRCWIDLAWVHRAPGTPLGVTFGGLRAHRAERERNHTLDLCLVGSRFMKRELEMNGFAPERVYILPPVVKRVPREPAPMPDEPHILFVGQLIRGKGVDLLLEAIAKLPPQYGATIVGEGNAREGLQARAQELGLANRVRFTGWVPNESLDKYYAHARVLAVPVRWPEPFGMIGLEAMHHGRPVVAFATGGIPDWLDDGKTGFLIGERDVEGFAAGLLKLLEDKDLATRLGQNGWEKVKSEYSFDGYVRSLVTLLEKVSQ